MEKTSGAGLEGLSGKTEKELQISVCELQNYKRNNIFQSTGMINKHLLLLLVLFGVHAAFAAKSDSVFFARLEGELRSDYFTCTGDTTQRPIEELVAWKHWTDSLVGLPDFNKTTKEYLKRTGRSPVKDGKCVVALWKLEVDSLAAIDSAATKEKADLKAEINAQPKYPCAIGNIPFGISRQSFITLAGKARFGMMSYEGEVMLCQKIPLGNTFLPGQFHFDTNGKFDRYELQGPSCPIDSLYISVWPLVETLTSFFWNTIGAPPVRVNRVNQQDIAEGKLSLCKVWSDPSWSVAVGLSVEKYRYYAKVVVTNKPLPED